MQEIEEELCKEAFAEFDKLGTGTIQKTELTPLLRSMGQNPTDSEVNDMINEVDVDGSGVLDFREFASFVARLTKETSNPENEVREAYRRFDPEAEGFVTVEELKFVMSNLPVRLAKDEIEELVQAADKDGDGKINFEEFRVLMGK